MRISSFANVDAFVWYTVNSVFSSYLIKYISDCLYEHMERGCAKILPSTNLNMEDAMDRGRWKKLIKIG